MSNDLTRNFANFQKTCWDWLPLVFNESPEECQAAISQLERARRFFEEATELAQAAGMSREDAHRLVDYTYDKEPGDPFQEVGGVMVTLVVLAERLNINTYIAGWTEIDRCHQPEIMEKIRRKRVTKELHGLSYHSKPGEGERGASR
jgi:hypothetical protein